MEFFDVARNNQEATFLVSLLVQTIWLVLKFMLKKYVYLQISFEFAKTIR